MRRKGGGLLLIGALAMMTMTVVVAFCSEFLSDSIGQRSRQPVLHRNDHPPHRQMVRHITAVLVAAKNKMDLAIGWAWGQASRCTVYPFIVLVGWASNVDFTMSSTCSTCGRLCVCRPAPLCHGARATGSRVMLSPRTSSPIAYSLSVRRGHVPLGDGVFGVNELYYVLVGFLLF